MNIKVFELINPTEENRYCVFDAELENNENVFFHMTLKTSAQSIIDNGFKSAIELGVGNLESVSYAKRSSSCFANIGCHLQQEYAIFAVKFDQASLSQVADNPSDIHVYKPELQPEILGVVYTPSGFKLT